MNLVDRANRQRSLTAMSLTLRSGRIAANAGVPTTTYAYDANGNLIQAGGWSYMWDYLNRMLASGYNNSTTTYAYDPSGARVLQTSTTSTTYYPNKYYSFTSTKSGANTYATSTNYIFNGDTLLATIDQALYNGAATGSPITRYIHPDHLGSTNVVTDAKRQPRAAPGLLSVRCDPHCHLHLPDQREAAIHRAILLMRRRDSIILMLVITIRSKGSL